MCGGRSALDCNGVCDGHAFRDDCTGVCVNNSQQIEDWSARDCRGLCSTSSHMLSGYLFNKDKCGVCRLQSDVPSPFEDCDGTCFAAVEHRKSQVCGHCVLPSEAKLLLDECGNCKSSGISCSCETDPTSCGCRNANNCYSVRTIHPVFVPKGLTRQVTLSGYFFPPRSDVQCIFRHERSGEVVLVPFRFDGMNRTSVTCGVNLNKGTTHHAELL